MDKDVYKLNNISVANVSVDKLDSIYCVQSVNTVDLKNDLKNGLAVIPAGEFDSFEKANAFLKENSPTDKNWFVTCTWKSGIIIPTAVRVNERTRDKDNLIQNEVTRYLMTACGYLEPANKPKEWVETMRKAHAQMISFYRKGLSSLEGVRDCYERCINEFGKTFALTTKSVASNSKSRGK